MVQRAASHRPRDSQAVVGTDPVAHRTRFAPLAGPSREAVSHRETASHYLANRYGKAVVNNLRVTYSCGDAITALRRL